jgi:hypothetical protein
MTVPTISPSDEVDRFVRTAKASDVPDATLVALLRLNGWSERRIFRSLGAYYGEKLGMAPPRRSGRGEHARDVFYYALSFITLGFWTIALGQLLYTLIDRRFPDAVFGSSGSLLSEIAWQLAAIIVAYPSFVFLGRLIARDPQRRPEGADPGLRALTYIALIVAAVVVLGDAIWFLAEFLRGELTTKFVLHSLVLFGIGGGVFAYYLNGLQAPAAER